jgi:hypothetical protein
MGETTVAVWTAQEQTIARTAFDAAQARAVTTLITAVQIQASRLTSVDALWQLHDYLSIQRHGIEGRFDFRLDGILFVFASLVKDGLLGLDELDGLDAEKLAKIAAMARF